MKAAGATQKQLGLVRLHEQTKKNLEQEIQVGALSETHFLNIFWSFLEAVGFFFVFVFFVCVKHSPVVVKILMLALWTNNLHVNDVMNFFPLIFVPEN